MKSTDDSKYILIRHAIVFIAYETNWSISRTVDWLLARDFERDIRAYDKTDGSYHKINNEEMGFDIATKYLFKRVTIGGHGELYNEKKDFDKAYYRIDDLNNNSLLDRLDLDFYQINNYSYSTDRDGYVTALNTNLCDIAHKLKIMVIPTPAVRPAKPDLLEQYQIELEQLASNDCEAIRQKNIQLDIDLTTANEEIADLKSQPAQAQPKNTPADDVTLATRSQNLAAKIILALIDIAELNRDSQPYQYDELNSNNRLIYDQIKANGMNVSQQKIGHWLDLAIRQVKDK